jgi:Tol biopolymer transport system component
LASNLVANDTNDSADIFVYDAVSAAIERVSVANDGSEQNSDADYGYDISADGRYVVFASLATNLVAGATAEQVYIRDRQVQTTTLVSINTSGAPGAGNSYRPRMSGDGHYVTFISCGHDLVAGDTSTVCNIYRRDLWVGGTEIVSLGMGGSAANGDSLTASSSTDGRFVAFRSSATNLVAGDTNGHSDIFVRDMTLQSTVRASVSNAGAQLAHGGGQLVGQSISGDGRFVLFYTVDVASAASDTNLQPDVYERDLVNNTTTLISVTPLGGAGDADSYPLAIAANGTVLFHSDSDDLAAGSQSDLYLYTPGSVPAVSALLQTAPFVFTDFAGALSAYGNVAFFNTYGLFPSDTIISQDYSLQIGAPASLTEISASPASYVAAVADNDSYEPALFGGGPTISADGRFVAFTSFASNLVAADTNAVADVFVRDRVTQATTRISTTGTHAQSSAASSGPVISADGRYITFTSDAELASPDNNFTSDVYRYDRLDYTLAVASVNGAGQIGNSSSDSPSVSDDGNVIAFRSSATNLVAGEVAQHSYVFVRDVAANSTQRVSIGVGGAEPNGDSDQPVVSGDGNVVCFESIASNLVTGVSGQHLYIYDRNAGTTEQIDVGPSGVQPDVELASCGGLSRDGRYAVFSSPARNLDPSSAPPLYEIGIYVRDRQNSTTTLVSKNNIGNALDKSSGQPHLSANGRYVTFVSFATNYDPLVPDYFNTNRVFIYDTESDVLFLASAAPNGGIADDSSYSPHLSSDGKRVVFVSYADNLTPLDGNGAILDVFVAEHYLDEIFANSFEACPPNIGCP